MLVVIDEFTRESLAIEVARSFTAHRVVEVLQYLFGVRALPRSTSAATTDRSLWLRKLLGGSTRLR